MPEVRRCLVWPTCATQNDGGAAAHIEYLIRFRATCQDSVLSAGATIGADQPCVDDIGMEFLARVAAHNVETQLEVAS